jgi:hypothetical protein
LAAQEGWEPSDTAIEKIELDAKYRTWVPTFAAYSIIILLHSIVENQLFALADRLGKKQDAKLRVKQVAGRGLEQAALYWSLLHDVQLLRNVIVHRGGNRGESPDQQKAQDDVILRHPNKLRLQVRGASEPTHENGLLTVSLGASTHPRIGVHLR